ncbi:MAG: phasin family protein [Magnetococcus sp. MYC-9]
MTQEMTHPLTELNQQWIGTVVDLQKLAGEIAQSMARQQCEAMVGLIDTASRQCLSVCQSRSVEEAMANQGRLFSELGESMLNNSLEWMGSVQKFQLHYGQVLGNDLSALFHQSMRHCMQVSPSASALYAKSFARKGSMVKTAA